MTPLEVKEGYAQGLAIGKLQRCNQGLGAVRDKADPLLSSASQSPKEWLDLEMKPETVNSWREIKRELTAALSALAEPRKGRSGLEVKQRRYIMIKGSWKREEQEA